MIRLPRKENRPLEPKSGVNPRILELQTAKEILGEIFSIYRYISSIRFVSINRMCMSLNVRGTGPPLLFTGKDY